MRAGTDTALARVVQVFGAVGAGRAHAYLFANRRANRMKVLGHDGIADGRLPVDNNWIENHIRPIAIGRSNWLFAGSLRAGRRAAAVMSLIQSAKSTGMIRMPI